MIGILGRYGFEGRKKKGKIEFKEEKSFKRKREIRVKRKLKKMMEIEKSREFKRKQRFQGFYIIVLISILSVVKVYSIKLPDVNTEVVRNLLFGNSNEKLITGELKPKSNEFFRVDDKDCASHNNYRRYENVPMNTGVYGITAYNSMINGDLSRWIKKDYNISGIFNMPSYYRGFDERYFLETAWGVKYKINYSFKDSNDIPFGYYVYDIDTDNGSASVLKNKYDIGIDLWYDSVIDKEQFERLDFAVKDACILQTAFAENTKNNYHKASLDDVTSEVAMSEWVYENCEYTDGKISVKENNSAKIIIPFEKQEGHGEYLFSFNIVEENDRAFKIIINDKELIKQSGDSQWAYPLDHFSFKVSGDTEALEISLPDQGIYAISQQRLYFNSYNKLEEWIKALNKYNLENLDIRDNYIFGTINNKESGILALSVPYNDGWKCFIDGEEADILKVNGLFTGIELKEGRHSVKLEFFVPLLKEGALISLFSIIISIVIVFYKMHMSLK